MQRLILIVEDEEDLADLLEYHLQKVGFDTISMYNSSLVRKVLDEERISLILMDRNLPSIDGADYIKSIRKDGYDTPVIYITAKNSDADILDGFEKGADDYITKPFNINELLARVKAVIKRNYKEIDTLKVKDIFYNSSSKKFFIDKIEISLTHLEHDLLLEFITNQNRVLSREYLVDKIWKDSFNTQLKSVNVAIKRLKEKIDPTRSKKYIKSVRGEGYIFE